MEYLFLTINLLIFNHLDFTQNPVSKEEEIIFINPETPPSPKEGMEIFYQFIQQNLQYPVEAKAKKIQGKVFVQFMVEKNGELTDIKVLRGLGYGCDEEAIRVLQKSPIWNPGKFFNKVEKIRMSIPIFFKLD